MRKSDLIAGITNSKLPAEEIERRLRQRKGKMQWMTPERLLSGGSIKPEVDRNVFSGEAEGIGSILGKMGIR